ncbi:hypothetical protein ACS0TY_020498 [Phlomoides rotata]
MHSMLRRKKKLWVCVGVCVCVCVKWNQEEKLAEGIKLYALSTTATSKRSILSDLVTVYAKGGKAIVFTQTK